MAWGGGGSRSTWTKDGDSPVCWPYDWLPHDPAFQNARIHTFGYTSNWGKESILNVRDFAKSLIGAIRDCPTLPHDSETPIVFVGHSMGGLVIKKAFVLSRHMSDFEFIARRTCAIFFLATPHRGSDHAQVLSRMSQILSGPDSGHL